MAPELIWLAWAGLDFKLSLQGSPALAAGRAKQVGRETARVNNWSRGDNAEAVGSGHGRVGTRHPRFAARHMCSSDVLL